MKTKFLLLSLIFTGVSIAQTTTCGCGSKRDGRTIEFSVVAEGGGCCGSRVTGNAYSFEWEHQGGGVYEMTGSSQYSLASDAQRDCCENA